MIPWYSLAKLVSDVLLVHFMELEVNDPIRDPPQVIRVATPGAPHVVKRWVLLGAALQDEPITELTQLVSFKHVSYMWSMLFWECGFDNKIQMASKH